MTSTARIIGVGPRLAALIAAAYRVRHPLLLEGPSGIGKSEIVHEVARKLAIGCVVLDLSLLDPTDLLGMPVIDGGRTCYAAPAILPAAGAGLLLLEELNRAEVHVQQPALQLLSARRLHEYRLPDDWSVVAAINPDDADYDVRPLDRAMADRFLRATVQAEREDWLSWAMNQDVHRGVLALVRQHDHALQDVSPRRWARVSALLHDYGRGSMTEQTLLDALAGYLPQAWVAALWSARASWSGDPGLPLRRVLQHYAHDATLHDAVRQAKAGGRTDTLDALVGGIEDLLRGTALGPLPAGYTFDLASFEQLLLDLPADAAERLQYAFGENRANCRWLGLETPGFAATQFDAATGEQTRAWLPDPRLRHRGWAVLNALLETFAGASALDRARDAPSLRAILRPLLPAVEGEQARHFRLKAQRFGVLPGYAT